MNKPIRLIAKWLRKILGERFYQRTDALGHTLEAWVAAAVNGFPGKRLNVIGVTGTNGKTTAINFIDSVLRQAGYMTGVSTTVNFRVGEEEWENDRNMTVSNPWTLQKLLKRMRSEQMDWAILEATSHALEQGRLSGIAFDVGVMTNLRPDHLDYHGTMENYAAAKAKLFRMAKRFTALNRDDEWYDYFQRQSRCTVYTYGEGEDTQVRFHDASFRPDGTGFQLQYGEETDDLRMQLPGKFNLYNALAAATVAYGLDVTTEDVVGGLEKLSGVVGRMESVEAGQKFNVIIDYAHSPDAYEDVLKSIQELTEGRVIAVFGGAANHDYTGIGMVAGRLADVAIVTDDEPMNTDPEEIRRAIVKATEESGHAEVHEVPDRREGIAGAFAMAEPEDTVVLLGLGHQSYRRVSGERIPWNDREVAEALLKNGSSIKT